VGRGTGTPKADANAARETVVFRRTLLRRIESGGREWGVRVSLGSAKIALRSAFRNHRLRVGSSLSTGSGSVRMSFVWTCLVLVWTMANETIFLFCKRRSRVSLEVGLRMHEVTKEGAAMIRSCLKVMSW